MANDIPIKTVSTVGNSKHRLSASGRQAGGGISYCLKSDEQVIRACRTEWNDKGKEKQECSQRSENIKVFQSKERKVELKACC